MQKIKCLRIIRTTILSSVIGAFFIFALPANASDDISITSTQLAQLKTLLQNTSVNVGDMTIEDLTDKKLSGKKYDAISSMEKADILDLLIFLEPWSLSHIEPAKQKAYLALINDKVLENEAVNSNDDFFRVAAFYEFPVLDSTQLLKNVNGFVNMVVLRNAVLEKWTQEDLSTYKFDKFEQDIAIAVSGGKENTGELWEKWLLFVLRNNQLDLFESH